MSACALLVVACGSQRPSEDFAAVYQQAASSQGGGVVGGTADGSDVNGDGNLAFDDEGFSSDADGEAVAGPALDGGEGAAGSGGNGDAGNGPGAGGGSDGGAEGGNGNGDGGGERSGPRETVTVGTMGILDGPLGGAFLPHSRAIQAWAASVNAAGGVDGHPIELTLVNDRSDPARHRSLVQQLVEEEQISAFVGNVTPLTGQASVEYLEERGVPVIGSEGGSLWVNRTNVHFPQMPTSDNLSDALAVAIANAAPDAQTVALMTCAEISGCEATVDPGSYERAGLEVVYSTRPTLAAPNYTSQCINAQNAGADVLMLGMDGQSVQRIVDSCNSVGYEPVYGVVPQAVIQEHTQNPSLDGMLAPSAVAPHFATDIAGVAEFRRAMSQFAPGVQPNQSAMHGWVAAKLLERAIEIADDPTDPEQLIEALYALDGEDLGGLTHPISFPRGGNHGRDAALCFWDIRVGGGEFRTPNDNARICP